MHLRNGARSAHLRRGAMTNDASAFPNTTNSEKCRPVQSAVGVAGLDPSGPWRGSLAEVSSGKGIKPNYSNYNSCALDRSLPAALDCRSGRLRMTWCGGVNHRTAD